MTKSIKKLKDADEREFIRMTGCTPQCQTKTYSLELSSPIRNSRDNSNNYNNNSTSNNMTETADMVLRLYVPEAFLTAKEDYYLYDGYELIADAGGLMGMLLGISLLAVYDAAVKICRKAGKNLDIV